MPDPAPPSSPRAPLDAPALREVARIRVIYGDTDQMGVVYYANYLRYFEAARNEYLRTAGASYRRFEETHDLFLPVVKAHVEYHRPARYDDELRVLAAVEGAGAASARFWYQIRRAPRTTATPGDRDRDRDNDGELLVSGYTVHACVTRAGKAVRLPPEMRAALGIPAA